MFATRSAARRFPAVHASVPGPVITFPHNHANALGRNKKMIRLRRAAAGLVVLSCAGVTASGAQPTQVAPPTVAAVAITTPVKLAAPARPVKSGSTSVYIVKLKDPGAASYGNASIYSAGRPVAQSANAQRAARAAFAQRLEQIHDRLLADVGAPSAKLYSYRYALNGFAAKLSAAEASRLAQQPRGRARLARHGPTSRHEQQLDVSRSREPDRRPACRPQAARRERGRRRDR